jgi:RNA polymerase sigma-70 factor (ECF subfamily)
VQIKTIVKECIEGQKGAWNMLVNAYSKRIFNMAYQFTGTYEEAEDMTQEIFMKLYTTLEKYDFEKNFSAWFLTLAKNYLIDHYRKTKWEKKSRNDFNEHYLSAEASDRPDEGVIRKESKKMIWEGLNQLSSEVRMTLILRDIQGKSYEEITEIMSLPQGTVKSRVNRGRLQLAKILIENRRETDEI